LLKLIHLLFRVSVLDEGTVRAREPLGIVTDFPDVMDVGRREEWREMGAGYDAEGARHRADRGPHPAYCRQMPTYPKSKYTGISGLSQAGGGNPACGGEPLCWG